MRISFLLFIAAVPLLGEAQLNKPRNEAKKGKKMAKEETPSSCLTGSTISTQEEMPPLVMELPRSVNLFGQPGTRHRIPVRVSNLGSQPTHMLLAHQEAFPVLSLDTSGTHVELVAGIQPTEVEAGAQSSATVHILITVPSYVPPSHRSKVTVIARPVVSNETEEDYHRRHAALSFYFTVVQPGRTLADNDLTPPSCSLLCMDQCRPGDCQGWTARVLVHDESTGLGWTKVVWPKEESLLVRREADWPFGTTQASVLSIQGTCCQEGVLLEQSDLAGHTVMCRIGEVATMGSSGNSISLLLFLCNVIFAFTYE